MGLQLQHDLTGRTFCRLLVLERISINKKKVHWLCLCECGNECVVDSIRLRQGRTKSCGCYRSEFSLKKKRFDKTFKTENEDDIYSFFLSEYRQSVETITNENPRTILIEREKSLVIDEVLNTLTEREKKVIRMRTMEGMTLDACGLVFNVQRERIRQIEAKAIRKLRHPARSQKLIEYFELDRIAKERERISKERAKQDEKERQEYCDSIRNARIKRQEQALKKAQEYQDFWEKRRKFTIVLWQKTNEGIQHPYFMQSNTYDQKIARIMAYAEYYNCPLEELELIFNETDMQMVYSHLHCQRS